jgi:hypothetical protein
LVELGWFEGEVTNGAGQPVAFRVDAAGDGLTDPARGTTLPIDDHRLPDGRDLKSAVKHFHTLAAGDHLWPGQVVAWVQSEPAEVKRPTLKLPGKATPEATPALRVPQQHALWQVLKVHVEPHAAVSAGTVVASIAPVDPHTHAPVEVVARLEIAEEKSEEVAVGQTVRLFSSVYNPRFHGPAEGKLVSIEPLAEMHADGKRYFHATAAVTHAPYPLKLGSGVTAKVVLGRKTVYRIILEH